MTATDCWWKSRAGGGVFWKYASIIFVDRE